MFNTMSTCNRQDTKGENKLIEKKKQKKLKNKKQRKILRQTQVVKTVMFI